MVIHDGLQVVEHFTSLVNPERKIPYNITMLTGITNEMVSRAPKFYEIAKKVVEMTEGKIFVAHNVNFDYNFIRNEFSELGFDFTRKKVCTVRLSRKLLPGHRSYSLGKLCNDLGIKIEGRHRAEGDAFATAKLFDILLHTDKNSVIGRSKDLDTLFSRARSGPVNALVEKLPEATGVYYFYDADGNIIYIGKSNNIRQRFLSHMTNTTSKKALNMANSVNDVSVEITGSELVALLLESYEIKKHKPLYNRSQVRSVFTYGISASYNMEGYIELAIVKSNAKTETFTSFVNQESARSFMHELVDRYELCQKLCGVYDSGSSCFNYKVKKCKGACISEESAESYNVRAKEAMDQYRFSSDNFFLIDKGRSKEERAVVQVKNGRYCGFGYVSGDEGVNEAEELSSVIKNYPDDRDVRQILRNYISSGKPERLITY